MRCLSRTAQGVLTIIGGVLIHLSLGTLYTFGNMNPYVSSYLRRYSQSKDILQTQTVWIFTLSVFGQGSFMVFGGLIERLIGCKLTVLLGGWIMSAGVLLTAATVKVNIIATVVTYGLMFGIGTGIAYAVALSAAMSWFPGHKGIIGGIVVAGFGGGALIFNQIQTYYINPWNLKPNATINGERFFTEEKLLHRVPSCFILIGCIYAAMQLLGAILIRHPPEGELDEVSVCYKPLARDRDEEETPITSNPADYKYGEEESEDDDEEDEIRDFRPLEVIKTRNFWIMWMTFFLNSQSITFISTLYKTFGQTFIHDDFFLAVVGSLSAVFNALCRILWGRLHDHFNYKFPMLSLCFLMAVMLSTFSLTSKMGHVGFPIWVCILFGVFSGNFALFPAATSATFGHKYMALNFGLLFTGNAVSGIIGATVTSEMSGKIGLSGVFYVGGGAAFLAFIITFFFQDRRRR